MNFSDATLLLIGHGSTVNDDSGATVFQHAAELRRRGLFAEVREAFFKIEPRIGPTLASITTPRIFVVPLFVSEGWFARQAIPRELGLPAGAQDVMPRTVPLAGRALIYCNPVGTHPSMARIILSRAREAMADGLNIPAASAGMPDSCIADDALRSRTALIIAGHGTKLNPDSRKSIERQVELIKAQNIFAEVHPAFLEEEPRIADVPGFVCASKIVIVPFFMSDGLHVCEDIPLLLGEGAEVVRARLSAGTWPWLNPTRRNGRQIYYARSVGSDPEIAEIILERVRGLPDGGGWFSNSGSMSPFLCSGFLR